jgi:hypothetical protein
MAEACAEEAKCDLNLDSRDFQYCIAANTFAAAQQVDYKKIIDFVSAFHLLPEMLTRQGDARFLLPRARRQQKRLTADLRGEYQSY